MVCLLWSASSQEVTWCTYTLTFATIITDVLSYGEAGVDPWSEVKLLDLHSRGVFRTVTNLKNEGHQRSRYRGPRPLPLHELVTRSRLCVLRCPSISPHGAT